MKFIVTSAVLAIICIASTVTAAENELVGTYKLVVEERTIVDTGEVVPIKDPQGYITYGSDRRMMVIIVRRPRPKSESIEKMSDQGRADLLRTQRIVYTTPPFRFHTDGKMSVNMLVWEKIN